MNSSELWDLLGALTDAKGVSSCSNSKHGILKAAFCFWWNVESEKERQRIDSQTVKRLISIQC